MGRSNETFSKKEKEKKKLIKAQQKKEKSEERKANSSKGKGLEDMMAYIDENGNISSTPPDPTKRKKVELHEIEISVSKQEFDPADLIKTGIISHFNTDKGYGFIRDLKTQESYFVHINSMTYQAKEGDKVTFETEKGPKGLNAVNVKRAV